MLYLVRVSLESVHTPLVLVTLLDSIILFSFVLLTKKLTLQSFNRNCLECMIIDEIREYDQPLASTLHQMVNSISLCVQSSELNTSFVC